MAEAVVAPTAVADPATVPATAKDTATGVAIDSTTPTPKPTDTLILGKFKTQEDLVQAYKELEQKQSGTPKDAAPVAPTPEAAQKAVKDSGVDMVALAREVAEKGELSKESLAALEKAGIKQDVADSYIEGQKAVAKQLTTEIQSVAGGAEKYTKMLDWAQTNMSDAQVKAFNEAIHSGNTEMAKLAVKGLLADYSAAVGTDGRLITGDSATNTSGVAPFRSQQEMIAAMSDPRYKNGDAAFIKDVEKRVSVSKIFGA